MANCEQEDIYCIKCGRVLEWDGYTFVCPNWVLRKNGHESDD